MLDRLCALASGRPAAPAGQATAAAAPKPESPLEGAEVAPTPLSIQVRALRTGGVGASMRQNMLMAFDSLMQKLDEAFSAHRAGAPEGFEERIDYYARRGMGASLRRDMHKLRIWRNAAAHQDEDRWRRDGPRSTGEASSLIDTISCTIEAERLNALVGCRMCVKLAPQWLTLTLEPC